MPKEYVIETIDDLCNIPADRMETCLAEILPSLQGISTIRALGLVAKFTKGKWIDDGKEDLTIRLELHKKGDM